MTLTRILSLVCAYLLIGCVTVDSVSISQIPEKSQRRQKIVSESSSPIIFLIPFGSDYVERAHEEFLSKCPKGAIEGVVSKHENTRYFGSLVSSASLRLQGYCVAEQKPTGRRGRRKT